MFESFTAHSLTNCPGRLTGWAGRSSARENEGVPLLSLVTECLRAHRAEDWGHLRELLHPDARIGVFAAGGKPVEVERAIEAMRAAHSDVFYSADVTSMRGLDDHAVILEGAVSYRSDEGHYASEPHAWLYVFVDGRLYRSEMFDSAAEAHAAYREHGLELGV
jgi:hypothetical protein